MKILPLVPAFLTTVAAVQPQGIIEIEWPSNCGYASKATNPAIPAANPTVIETPKIASAQAGIPNPVATDAPNEQVPDPGVYSPHSSPSAPVYSQQEQKSEPKTGNSSPYGNVKSGKIFYYGVGMGACGQNSSGQDETGSIVAISGDVYDAAMIDSNTNNNPLCGRTITMKGSNGKTAQ
ncbi:RlpA-like domain superfamily, partial [Fusarium oxysporum f. sp. vasinfectum]